MSDINDSTAAASAATPAEGKPTTPARRNAATQGAPRGAGSRTAKQGRTMLGAEAVVASLEAEGVTTVFGYPGGQAIKLYDALYDSDQITHVLARHEQGAVHMADGYARSTGRAGVAIVTSGPGATNTVTGIATAYMDSVPLVVITGQVGRGVIGTDSFQESDIVGITMPVVKHSYLLQSTDELTRTIREAFHIAVTGRPGPVLIDIPSDVAGETMVFEYPDAVNLPSYKPTYRGNAKQIRAACRLLEEAEQPLLYVGGGVISSEATDEIVALMDKMRIPAVVTLMGKGGVPASHPLNLGPVGMHGAKYSNMAMTEAGLIIAAGARFSDRVTGRVTEFAPNAKIVHIDIDPAEIGKIRDADVPIVGDLKGVHRRHARGAREGRRHPARRPVDRRYRRVARPLPVLPPEHGRERGERRDRPRARYRRAGTPAGSGGLHRHHRGGPAPDVGAPVPAPGVPAHLPLLRGSGHHGLRFPGRHRSGGGEPRCHGGLHRRRRVVPDELPGNGHGRHQRRAREGHDPGQPLPRHGATNGRSCSTTSAILRRCLRPCPTS